MTLQHLFYPRNVALVGSVSEGKIGYELLRQMLRGGYRNVFVVNPKAQGALDVLGYAAIGDIPAPVDLAVISSPAVTVAGVLEECGQAGVKAAVIISSGFSEMGNKAGEAEIKFIATRHCIRIVGPNCAGIINTAHRLCPTMETLPPPGPVALDLAKRRAGGRGARLGGSRWAGHLQIRLLRQPRRRQRSRFC